MWVLYVSTICILPVQGENYDNFIWEIMFQLEYIRILII